MPKGHEITRRAMLANVGKLSAGACLAALVVAQVAPAVGAADERAVTTTEGREPLLRMINAYRAGLEEFNRSCPDDGSTEVWDTYAQDTWRPFYDALAGWEQPASTLEGAIAALRCAYLEERDCGNSEITLPLMAAAMGYFDRDHPT